VGSPEASDTSSGAADPVPRRRDADATRAQLLRAAKRRFTVFGFDRTTTRDIAADAGVNVSLIARYFGSKDGLYAAVLEESVGSFAPLAAGDLVESLLGGLRDGAWPEYGDVHPLLLLLRDAGEDERTAELRRRTLSSVIEHLADAVVRVEGSAEARVRAATVLALFSGVVTLRAALPGQAFGVADDAQLRTVLEQAIAGIVGSQEPAT